jgi:hypothetical protein
VFSDVNLGRVPISAVRMAAATRADTVTSLSRTARLPERDDHLLDIGVEFGDVSAPSLLNQCAAGSVWMRLRASWTSSGSGSAAVMTWSPAWISTVR